MFNLGIDRHNLCRDRGKGADACQVSSPHHPNGRASHPLLSAICLHILLLALSEDSACLERMRLPSCMGRHYEACPSLSFWR